MICIAKILEKTFEKKHVRNACTIFCTSGVYNSSVQICVQVLCTDPSVHCGLYRPLCTEVLYKKTYKPSVQTRLYNGPVQMPLYRSLCTVNCTALPVQWTLYRGPVHKSVQSKVGSYCTFGRTQGLYTASVHRICTQSLYTIASC